MSTVLLFPGQSSVDPRAIVRARLAHRAADEVAREATAVLGLPGARRYLDGDAALESNRDVQIVVFLATQMYLRALAAEGVEAEASLGLSLGEYSHLVHIGALDFAGALALVDERGRCYDGAPQGVMVTVLGADRDTVESVVAATAADRDVVVSNYNAPTQHVLAGRDDAVHRAAATLEEEHGAHTVVIEPHVPMHSPLMMGVALQFARALQVAPWRTPILDYVPNVLGAPAGRVDSGRLVDLLTRHVSEPVRWDAALDAVAARHPEATFVEVGPGGVLHNMLGRGWKRLARQRVDAPDGVEPRAHFSSVIEALCARA